ncbi:Arginine transport system permease protein ArtQ [Aquimixticola soesokkakensis]|uniref:Arginine transport system permease protein ArtQ n=1 Tax=Aquimixticola soesokkakensis TaxID=1519096 RepID=A0A1Y5RW94_9RHOB|nr:amino acid ABC transporter permease [Aquimixticola soesokkakensis]SLN26544.1 Arginine transport system permease protein ArtQ [Aquimixticola soesokkakensis]
MNFTDQFFNLAVLQRTWPIIVNGIEMTVLLALVSVPLMMLGGLAIALLGRTTHPVLAWAVRLYVDVMRAFPPLVLLMFLFYGLPFAGFDIAPFAAAALALTLNTSSYASEIFRGGFASVDKGQLEAARATGLSGPQAMILVVLPQAVRNVFPDLMSNVIELVKLTSIASVVALHELLKSAMQAQSLTYNATPLIVAAAIYFFALWPLVRITSQIQERRTGW